MQQASMNTSRRATRYARERRGESGTDRWASYKSALFAERKKRRWHPTAKTADRSKLSSTPFVLNKNDDDDDDDAVHVGSTVARKPSR
uniref:Uncharacterized protein n=1 Tax=Plectus sambesii TaxID=2011161 RepID=A0A914XMJ8_9BILA